MIKTEPPNRRLRIWRYFFSFVLFTLRKSRETKDAHPKYVQSAKHGKINTSTRSQWTLLSSLSVNTSLSDLLVTKNQTLYFNVPFCFMFQRFFSFFSILTNILRVLCKIILIYDQLTCDRRKRCHNHRIERRKGTIFVHNPCSFACSLVETLVFFSLHILNATYYYCMAKSEWKKNIVNIIINRFLCTF